jgi:hypothetical protein
MAGDKTRKNEEGNKKKVNNETGKKNQNWLVSLQLFGHWSLFVFSFSD